MYLDGNLVAQEKLASSSTGNALPVQIGRNGPGAGKYFRGKLDDVRLWSAARSASDISANFRQQLVGPQAGLVANWRFDESSGGVAADSSGKNHPATIAGGATFPSDIHP